MTKSPAEPTNLVLEQLRLMRADMNARFDRVDARFQQVDARFNKVDEEISALKKELRGMKLNTIAEICKANLTVASFADLDRRIAALEAKRS
jgi:uncharacterized protein YdcH (DUF465 family)